MSESKLIPLRPQDITPKVILETLNEDIPRIKYLFAVSILHDGSIAVSSTGDVASLALAALALTDWAKRCMLGENNGQG